MSLPARLLRRLNPLHSRAVYRHSKSLSAHVLPPGLCVFPFRMSSSSSSSSEAPRKSKVYTRTGDKGTTSLFTGQRLAKDAQYFKALGDTDELNACVGIAREHCQQAGLDELVGQLEDVQSRLFDVGAHVATPRTDASEAKQAKTTFSEENIANLERWIDLMDSQLPPLTTFILPGGGLCSAHLHLARTVARRAERRVVGLVRDEQVHPVVGRYLNRLSDFFFVAARFASFKEGKPDLTWQKQQAPDQPQEADDSSA